MSFHQSFLFLFYIIAPFGTKIPILCDLILFAAKICFNKALVVNQLVCGTLHTDFAKLQNISVVRDFERLISVLLYDKNGVALFLYLLYDLEYIADNQRSQSE